MTKPALLIIDDEPDFRQSISTALEDEFRSIEVSNGREALDVIRNNPVSLILLDLQMPEMTGMEVLETIRNEENEIPVLIMTGNSCLDWAEKCADLNVQGYIKKPVDVDVLMARIKRLLCMLEEREILCEIWNEDYERRMDQVSPLIKKTLGHICDNYRKEFDRGEIAACLEVSPDYLTHQFHKECGMSLSDCVNKLRVRKSKELLEDSQLRIKEIAAAVGIQNVSYFCAMFKERVGMSPKEYQKKILEGVRPPSIVKRSV